MRWTIKPQPEEQSLKALQDSLGVDAVIAKLLVQRGVTTYEAAREFFKPSLDDLHDPFLMKDMDKAVKRILNAIESGENVMIYGDYDVDGTTAVALVYTFLKESIPNITYYIPDRYSEGYGISIQGIDYADDNEISLVIALDCGVKALDQIKYAKEKEIDFIICDHHRPGPVLPEAYAILDPKRTDCTYPFEELCGCGIGFKLIQAITQETGEFQDSLYSYLDLVATAIGADIVPMVGENRVLATFGLQVINNHPRPGLRALRESTEKRQLTITDVVFILAPRINAAGRMDHGELAVELLSTTDTLLAKELAARIEAHNTERRGLDQEITEEALQQIREEGEEEFMTTVVFKEHWHKGVIGIVASRLTETYYRPTLVFTKSGDYLAASARSVRGYDIYEALEACSEHLLQFGGHTYAAGLTIKKENYLSFKADFEAHVSRTISKELLTPELFIDDQLRLEQITPKLVRLLKRFAPFGPGNRSPLFMSEGLRDSGYAKQVGSDKSHLKCALKQGNCGPLSAIGFGLGSQLEKLSGAFNAVYSIEENQWQGNTEVQLRIRDIK